MQLMQLVVPVARLAIPSTAKLPLNREMLYDSSHICTRWYGWKRPGAHNPKP